MRGGFVFDLLRHEIEAKRWENLFGERKWQDPPDIGEEDKKEQKPWQQQLLGGIEDAASRDEHCE